VGGDGEDGEDGDGYARVGKESGKTDRPRGVAAREGGRGGSCRYSNKKSSDDVICHGYENKLFCMQALGATLRNFPKDVPA